MNRWNSMMTIKSIKKRGRPPKSPTREELRNLEQYLTTKVNPSEVQKAVIQILQRQQYSFDNCSETEKILVKFTLQQGQEFIRLQLICAQLAEKVDRIPYESKLLEYYQSYLKNQLEEDSLNIFKSMCTSYLKFQDKKLSHDDLEKDLFKIRQTEDRKRQIANEQRQYELGAAVTAALQALKIDINSFTPEEIKTLIINHMKLYDMTRKTVIFQKIAIYESNYFKQTNIFCDLLNDLMNYQRRPGESLIEFHIKKSMQKLNK